MASLRNVLRTTPNNSVSRAPALSTPSYGRSPAYRRLISSRSALLSPHDAVLRPALPSLHLSPLRSDFLPESIILKGRRAGARSFQISSRSLAAEKPSTETKSSEPGQTSESTSEAKTESTAEEQARKAQEGEGKEGGEKAEDGAKKEKKEDLPPPPPHGDKTPWQVFMETMQSEFKQSKEWNESTKALASSAHQFTESESVRKAREAYETTTGAVSSTTGKIVKTTAGALGKGAQWTWETPVMKGVRKGANITGEALDKATKPIRETEAFKNVKDVIDDGSSSRYGGWVDKEERKRRREEFEKMHGGKPGEVLQEDPK
jgi:import inner membrane translocase subunit TIM44